MMVQGVSINALFDQSIGILKSPDGEAIKQAGQQGSMRETIIYLGVAAGIAGVVALLSGLLEGLVTPAAALPLGLIRLLLAVVAPIGGFFIFAFILHAISKQQGGSLTQNEIIYTTALFAVPILGLNAAVGSIPKIGCVYQPVAISLLLYQTYIAYLYLRTDANLIQNRAVISAAVAGVAMIIFLITMGVIGSATGMIAGSGAVGCVSPITVAGSVSGAEIAICPALLNF